MLENLPYVSAIKPVLHYLACFLHFMRLFLQCEMADLLKFNTFAMLQTLLNLKFRAKFDRHYSQMGVWLSIKFPINLTSDKFMAGNER
ncbi:hypothetical protein [Campylobacter curvus]|uniref:hypothetical protein n=1 Tax=Campylobacter curvus TaxID=200 RepID=UPI00147082D5|nr:hypothetical protein [Campylobacter curvus]